MCAIIVLRVYVCYFVFFFFKQKTAYEMRISDWSSDVCSSDLPGLAAEFKRQQATRLCIELPADIEHVAGDRGRAAVAHQHRHVLFSATEKTHRAAENAASGIEPTGRASCRARVCKYV